MGCTSSSINERPADGGAAKNTPKPKEAGDVDHHQQRDQRSARPIHKEGELIIGGSPPPPIIISSQHSDATTISKEEAQEGKTVTNDNDSILLLNPLLGIPGGGEAPENKVGEEYEKEEEYEENIVHEQEVSQKVLEPLRTEEESGSFYFFSAPVSPTSASHSPRPAEEDQSVFEVGSTTEQHQGSLYNHPKNPKEEQQPKHPNPHSTLFSQPMIDIHRGLNNPQLHPLSPPTSPTQHGKRRFPPPTGRSCSNPLAGRSGLTPGGPLSHRDSITCEITGGHSGGGNQSQLQLTQTSAPHGGNASPANSQYPRLQTLGGGFDPRLGYTSPLNQQLHGGDTTTSPQPLPLPSTTNSSQRVSRRTSEFSHPGFSHHASQLSLHRLPSVVGEMCEEPEDPVWWTEHSDQFQHRFSVDVHELQSHFNPPSAALAHRITKWDAQEVERKKLRRFHAWLTPLIKRERRNR